MKNTARPQSCLLKLFLMPAGCLIQIPPLVILVVLAAGLFGGLVLYNQANFDLFGLWRPNFSSLKFNADYTLVQTKSGASWTITYEKPVDSVFTGLVRHVGPIRLGDFPFLTHDVLVTTGDFANSALVTTTVSNHHFTWVTPGSNQPQGTINLLHVVPLNEEIYQQLMGISGGQQVTISGAEIRFIEAYKPSGELIDHWQDDGCNSILVKSVQIIKKP